METRTYICRKCGKPFEITADAFIPGVEGFVNGSTCGYKVFFDPTKKLTCDECFDQILEEIRKIEGSS